MGAAEAALASSLVLGSLRAELMLTAALQPGPFVGNGVLPQGQPRPPCPGPRLIHVMALPSLGAAPRAPSIHSPVVPSSERGPSDSPWTQLPGKPRETRGGQAHCQGQACEGGDRLSGTCQPGPGQAGFCVSEAAWMQGRPGEGAMGRVLGCPGSVCCGYFLRARGFCPLPWESGFAACPVPGPAWVAVHYVLSPSPSFDPRGAGLDPPPVPSQPVQHPACPASCSGR